MKSRNTAPRHGIDLVLGASYSRINLTSLPRSAGVHGGCQLPASSPCYKVKSILGSDTRRQPVRCWLPFL